MTEAIEAGQFAIYPVSHIDEAIHLLTGIAAGEADANGNYPEESINGKVQAQLQVFSDLRRSFTRGNQSDGNSE